MLGNAPFTSTDAIKASRSSSSRYMSYRKLASYVDLPSTDPHMLSGTTPAAYSLRCILPKTTIHTSLASVTAQHIGASVSRPEVIPFLIQGPNLAPPTSPGACLCANPPWPSLPNHPVQVPRGADMPLPPVGSPPGSFSS